MDSHKATVSPQLDFSLKFDPPEFWYSRSAMWIPVLLLFFCCHLVAQTQNAVRVPEFHPTAIGGGISDFQNVPPDLKLVPKDTGGRNGEVWIRNTGNALLIAGQVDGASPDFPRNQTLILSQDHIEVWLAAASDVPMPPIGWGNQFGEQLLPKGPDSCADWLKETGDPTGKAEQEQKCRSWAAQQQQYRNAFKKLFVRQWLLTPDYAIESYATPAYNLITSRYTGGQKQAGEEVPAMLKPKGKVQLWYRPAGSGHAYSFEITIPYTAFPPMNSTDLRDLWLMVDVFNAAPQGKKMGAYSSTSAQRVFGNPETFNHLQLEPGRSFRLTPCNVPLDGRDKYWNKHPGWFVPRYDQFVLGSEYQADWFIVVNEAQGYAYDPSGLSPIARPVHAFWRNIGPNQWVCGPQLSYQNGQTFKQYDKGVEEQGLDAKRLQDGTLLIKSGPSVYYSEFGSGQCGACPRYALDMYALDRNLNLSEALSLGGVVQGDDDAVDFSIRPDWSQVVQYKEQPAESNDPNAKPTWSATTYCLKDSTYAECGKKDKVQPPNSPLLKELRNTDQ